MLLLIQKYIKKSIRIKAPHSVNASKRKHKNQINHYDKHRLVLMAILLCARVNESPNPLVKVSRRGRHWVWGPNRRRAIKE